MIRLVSSFDASSAAAQRNLGANLALSRALHAKVAAAGQGGPARIRERHVARGKLLPRDRVERLLDPVSGQELAARNVPLAGAGRPSQRSGSHGRSQRLRERQIYLGVALRCRASGVEARFESNHERCDLGLPRSLYTGLTSAGRRAARQLHDGGTGSR